MTHVPESGAAMPDDWPPGGIPERLAQVLWCSSCVGMGWQDVEDLAYLVFLKDTLELNYDEREQLLDMITGGILESEEAALDADRAGAEEGE
jgi:hypothetical protein